MNKITFYFVLGSFVGWLMEIFFKTISKESLDRAGMGKGPFCMAYGMGVVLLLLFVSRDTSNLLRVFILSSFIGTTFEYITAVILEKVYGLVLWEYTKLKFAINDHICLEFIILWGIFGTIFCKFLIPKLDQIYAKVVTKSTVSFLYALAIYIIADYTVAGYYIIRNKRKNIKRLQKSL